MNLAPLRSRRIIDTDSGGAVLLSFTAGMELGAVPGLGDLPAMIGTLAKTGYLTGAVVHAGVLQSLFDRFPDLSCGVVVDLFGGTWMTTRPERREQVCTLEHAVRVGADAVLATISLASLDEAHQLRVCGQVARDCAAWGLPFVIRIDTTQTDARRQYSSTLSGHGARLAYELGADVVVVNFSDSAATFAESIQGIPIPVLIGGGPQFHTDEAMLESLSQAKRAGARGLALGAPLFWQDGPTEALARAAGLFLKKGD